ncbi:hypothetical protein GF339_13060 [candidate division KSB3 bacterium]|uniref:Calcineurin-like phosphoesterase domain-containing protein n=1 Tax=candidate division KSB3 bacterium TaxID=2044937 RepID=A0A9D5Q6L7_9BACT|nr:hypothetical protein [candidate division KSB3 bacterium]MBD3325513.1 hypothetical protein [candidate division KSB3 bacterium]
MNTTTILPPERRRQSDQPVITVRGGFLRSFEHNVALIRGLGFQMQIKIFQPLASHGRFSLTLLVENIRGDDIVIKHQGGEVRHVIRAKTSVMCEVTGSGFQTISLVSPASQTDEFDFIFCGDIHGRFQNLQQILTSAAALNPLFVLVNGDLTHSGRLAEYHILADILNKSHVPLFTSMGNHDKRARGGRATYRRMLAPFYYSFGVRDCRFIVLDSSRKRGLQRFQYKWLERELHLARHQRQRIFVVLHRPPVCPKYNYLSFSATSNIRRFLRLMEAFQVEMVFGSHIHVLTEFRARNVPYVVTGGGGGALWQPSNVHHYLHVFVRKRGVELQVIPLPTPEAKVSQRLKDAIKLNLEHHLATNRRLKHAATLGTTSLAHRTPAERKRPLWKRNH